MRYVRRSPGRHQTQRDSDLGSALDAMTVEELRSCLRDALERLDDEPIWVITIAGIRMVRLEENMAEKIARLNRATPARDAYDLVWIMRNPGRLGRGLDPNLIRRLAVMKAWVDMNGLGAAKCRWSQGHDPKPFDVALWLRARSAKDFDDEDIGLLATPPAEARRAGPGTVGGRSVLARTDV